ncbi:MAG: AAA family ATPase, partial [Akkermansiaceae bacterium]
MKIDKLHIRSPFKNLDDVLVDFDENHLMTVIVGSNGSGKSNVLEALVSIFRNLDLGETPLFSYQIEYSMGQANEKKSLVVDADPKRGTTAHQQYSISLQLHNAENTVKIPISKVKRDKDGHSSYLPKYTFAYYSGPSDRLEKYFRKHRTDFYNQLLKSNVNLEGDIRPLFYAKPNHSQFVLLAFFLSENNSKEKEFLKEHVGIEALDSVHFVMRKPRWCKDKKKQIELFWGAKGVVREFLDTLYEYTLAPLKITRNEDTTLTGSNTKNEFFHLFLQDVTKLKAFAKDLAPDVFFKMLESTLLSEIISEVSIRVKVKGSNTPLSFKELSEGEQQLLTVLGLLKFTGDEDSLFLLDEPDTHLNPNWASKYLSFLHEFAPSPKSSHLLMVTHHPLAIAELEKEQVQVMSADEDFKISAKTPELSPRGLGYSGILMSDMFGLKSDVDQHTHKKLIRRAQLAAIDDLTDKQNEELKNLNIYLDELGYVNFDSDPNGTHLSRFSVVISVMDFCKYVSW